MKRRWINMVAGLVAVVFLSSAVGMQTPKASENQAKLKQDIVKTLSYKMSDGNQLENNGVQKENKEEVLHVSTPEQGKDSALKPESKQVGKTYNKANVDSKYTMADLNRMSYEDLVKILSGLKWNDVTDLFQYNNDAVAFYGDLNRMQYLINSLEEKGRTFTKDDSKGIPTIAEVLRAGFYLSFYNDGLKQLNDRAYRDKCIPAIVAIQKNPNFKLGTREQDEVIATIGLLVNNASCNVEVVNNFVPVLKQYDSNMAEFLKDPGKGKAIYNILNGVQYDLSRYVFDARGSYSNTPWNNKIDNFINIMSKWALMGNLNKDNEWLINNCIFYISTVGKTHSNNKEGQRVLTETMKMYEYLGEQYVQAAFSLKDNYEGKDYYGKPINVDGVKGDLSQKYLPKKYSFDDGKVIIKAGDKVAEEKIKKVYWASKEVQAQFFRNLGSDKPLEQGNPDDVLTIVIYNSPEEYKVNRLLNGLDVNNGGIYIESTGTFYTYERTTDESIYTLEELFRHEFTHYLQGRYLVPGMWGSSDIYKNNRLTWLEEGGAEFFAGSTRTSGILPRKSVVSNVARSDEGSWYTANQTMHSQYGSFEFYHYGFMLQNYMYDKEFVKLYDLLQAIKKNDVTKYDDLINKYSSDANLEKNYKNHMESLVSKYDSLTTPLVAEDYLKEHPKKAAKEVYDDISKVAALKDVKTEVNKSQFFNSFKLQGTFNAGKSEGKLKDLRRMDKALDGFLNTLNGYSWSGYKTVTAYMVDYNVDKDNNATWTLVFNGVLNDGQTENNNNIKPVANINAQHSGKVNEAIGFNSKGSYDKDGKIVEYLWDFGDESTSNEENPTHKYNKVGTYKVKLTVKDDKGDVDTKEVEVNITKDSVVDPIGDKEVECNDDFNSANPYVKANKLVSGTLPENDKDVFEFDVTEDGKVDINLMNYENKGINWLVYSSSDTDNYISYAQTRGQELNGSFEAKKGKYYLVVYNYEKPEASYGFKINGNIVTKSKEVFEKEDNNSFDLANYMDYGTVVNGSLDENDNTDKYYFDVKDEGDYELVVEKKDQDLGVAWKLFNEKDLNNYVAYPTNRDGNKLSSKTKLKPGRYYFNVYRYSGEGKYTVAVEKCK